MILFPNAKINIGLHITEKRADGYHNIESFFYPISWQDILEIVQSADFQFVSSGINIPSDNKANLCVRAYELLKKDFELNPVHIHLHKVVPIGAGLGGGSADAAFTLKILNQLFNLKLSNSELSDYARQLGSDCAFFIENQAKYGVEKGDIYEDLAIDLKGKYIALVYPHLLISSQEAYQNVKPDNSRKSLRELLMNYPINEWKSLIINDFEKSIFLKYPLLAEIKQQLYDLGAIYTSMSGSGSTIFGIFEKEINLKPSFSSDYDIWSGEF